MGNSKWSLRATWRITLCHANQHPPSPSTPTRRRCERTQGCSLKAEAEGGEGKKEKAAFDVNLYLCTCAYDPHAA